MFYTPVAEWLYLILMSIFEDQLPDDDAYTDEFDRAEVMLGVSPRTRSTCAIAATPDGGWGGRSRWFGRSTRRNRSPSRQRGGGSSP